MVNRCAIFDLLLLFIEHDMILIMYFRQIYMCSKRFVAVFKLWVTCGFVFHTHSKLVTLWIILLTMGNFMQWNQGIIKHSQLQWVLWATALNDSPDCK